jgi:dolichol kinase
MAELGGKRWGNGSGSLMNGQKSVAGSISFAISALLISMACGYFFNLPLQQMIVLSIATTLIATITETISTKGLDNITVPLITLICLLLLLND